MNPRLTLIISLLAIALGIFAYTQRDAEPIDYTDGGPTPTPAPVLDLAGEDVQSLSIESVDGNYEILRVSDHWEVDDEPLSEYVNETIGRLANPNVLRVLPADSDEKVFGFDTPTLTVTFKTTEGESVVHVGAEAPVEPQFYLRKQGEDRIVMVAQSDWQSLIDWQDDPPYEPTPTPEVTEAPEEDTEALDGLKDPDEVGDESEEEAASASDAGAAQEDEDASEDSDADEDTSEPEDNADADDSEDDPDEDDSDDDSAASDEEAEATEEPAPEEDA